MRERMEGIHRKRVSYTNPFQVSKRRTKGTHLSQFSILCLSVGWFTPETAKQTARTAEWSAPAFERASAITCSRVSLAAISELKTRKMGHIAGQEKCKLVNRVSSH